MKSTLANDLKFAGELEKLRKMGNLFGVGDALVKQIDDYLDDCETKVTYWVSDTFNDMVESSPNYTGNLKDSLVIDESNYPKKTFVGIDVAKMTEKAGEEYPGVWKPPDGVYPNYEYTEQANKWAEKHPDITTAPQGEFIHAVWFEKAKKHAKKYFKYCKFYKNAS